jgi:hypothetical protein
MPGPPTGVVMQSNGEQAYSRNYRGHAQHSRGRIRPKFRRQFDPAADHGRQPNERDTRLLGSGDCPMRSGAPVASVR